MPLEEVLTRVSTFSCFIPLLAIALVKFRLPKSIWPVGVLFILAAPTEAIAHIMAINYIPNLLVYFIFSIVEFILVAWFFYANTPNQWIRYYILITSVFVLALFATELNGNINLTFSSIAKAGKFIALITYAIGYLIMVFRDQTEPHLLRSPTFVLSAGFLIYFCGNILVFAVVGYLLQTDPTEFVETWMVHSVINIICNVIYGLGLWLNQRKLEYH